MQSGIIAITRHISPNFNKCELTHLARTPIDLDIARIQHHEYTQVLKELGCDVLELPAEEHLPDSVFVEDTAFILPEVAVITRPGADSRKPETESITRALRPYRNLVFITGDASLDGGDVLVILGRKDIYIGMSTRSNLAAVEQLRTLIGGHGYRIHAVELNNCLHLKSAVTCVDTNVLLVNRDWVDIKHFDGYDIIDIDPSETFAANCLLVNGEIIYPTSFPRTRAILETRGFKVRGVQVDELAKAEGAVTCCSLLVQ